MLQIIVNLFFEKNLHQNFFVHFVFPAAVQRAHHLVRVNQRQDMAKLMWHYCKPPSFLVYFSLLAFSN
jgi:hypothetical protein